MRGSCLCGGVAFEVAGARPTVTFCHCSQCRKVSGHYWAATRAPRDQVVFDSDATLRWFRSSDWAERGFCGTCGASLFYRLIDEDGIGIAMGCLDGATGFRPGKHIFCNSKGDYYDVPGDAPHVAE